MEKVENSVSKDLYKVFLLILRGIPFLNTIVHEAKHIQSHICKYYKVKEDTEQAAYLIGYIIQKMHRVFRYMISTGTV